MKVVNSVSRIMGYVATGMLVPMLLLTVVDVFLRYVFNSPITGTAELTKLMMVGLVLGMGWCAVQKGHISVDVVMGRLPPRVQAAIESVTLTIGLATLAAVTWQSFEATIFTVLKHKYVASQILPVPMFPFYLIYVLGCAILFLVLFGSLIEEIRRAVKG